MRKSWYRSTSFKLLLSVFILLMIAGSALTVHYYNYYWRIIDLKLSGEIFNRTATVYAAPYLVYAGQRLTPQAVIDRLHRAGFEPAERADLADGSFEVDENKVTIRPNTGEAIRLEFGNNSLSRIVKVSGGSLEEAYLPPEQVTNLFDASRQKRRVVKFEDLPRVMVDAVTAAEDQRFFRHWGLDPIRITGAILASIRNQARVEGVSTITQQLARNFFLTLDRSMKRKVEEAAIALILEQRLTKQQILTLYANEVYLGNRGSFAIHGFGEGAVAYFGKDLAQLTLSEAATLAGIIPSPNSYSPSRYPDRAQNRRNLVLAAMLRSEAITAEEYESARGDDLELAPIRVDESDAPYLVDFVRRELLKDFSEEELINNSLRVHTTLDPDLQKAAVEAVANGLKFVEEQLTARQSEDGAAPPMPQAALIALDPRTGEIKAMVGGSDYGASQYNRITDAFRQPGSIFKPFVFAAALETAFDENPPPEVIERSEAEVFEQTAADQEHDGDNAPWVLRDLAPRPVEGGRYITPVTVLIDEPTTFIYEDDRIYEPNNYRQQYRGLVTLRTALQHSLNVPTIKIAERIGYERVAEFARRAELNTKILGYPSVALGAFEVTPLEMAGAYTIFANEGKWMQPHALLRVVGDDPARTKTYNFIPKEVIRPELAYLMTNLMEGVVNSGTGASVRARGFRLPAAGKTGTSRDGWFAGYTKDFLVIAWVGYDDNSDLNLEGARSALPIWTEFMMKAAQLYPPRDADAMRFSPPQGIAMARIDSESMMLANPSCDHTFEEAFIAGTQPAAYCPLHGFRFVISSAVEEGVKETGRGVGRALSGLGRVFGGLFGRR